MDAGWVTLTLAEIALVWFAIKTYIKNQRLESDNERLKEKVEDLKEWVRNSKG